jgi:hypothetical protein
MSVSLRPSLLAAALLATTVAIPTAAATTLDSREYPPASESAFEAARVLSAASRHRVGAPTSIVIPTDNLLRNGGFEEGMSGWTTIERGLGAFAAHQSGPAPHSGLPAPAAREGRFQALLDQRGAGSHLLFQDVAVPEAGAYLSCELYLHNAAGEFVVGPGLRFEAGDAAGAQLANQHVRVDLLDPTAMPHDVGAGVWRNLLLTSPGSSSLDGWFRIVADLDDFAGSTVRLRFAAVDNLGHLQLGVDGCAVRSRARVSTATAAEEAPIVPVDAVRPQNPKTVYFRDGGKAVFWQQDGPGGIIICAQFFDAQDQPLTSPLLINERLGATAFPTGGFDPNGNAVIWWTFFDQAAITTSDDGRVELHAAAGPSVVGRTFSLNGAPLSGEIEVGTGQQPESSSARSGEQTLTWNDGGAILTQVFGPGGNPIGPPVILNLPGGGVGSPSDPQAATVASGGEGQTIATSASGDYVVVWRQASGSARGIMSRRFSDTGQPKGPVQVVDFSPAALNPAVGMDAAGNYVVAWEVPTDTGRVIFAARFDAEGRSRSGVFLASSAQGTQQSKPRVDVNEAGDFVIAWEEQPAVVLPGATAQGTSIVGRTFSANGQARQEDQVLAGPEPNNDPANPDVTINENDDVTVVFERRRTNQQSRGIFRREIDFVPPTETCTQTGTEQCLRTDRFRVSALFEQPNNRHVSSASAVRLTGDTGYFTFFDPSNVEAVVKVLNGCAINGRFWVFAAGLTNVEVTLRVDDVITGRSVSYFNRRGNAYQPILDTDAFPNCPGAAATAEAVLTDAETDWIAESLLRELDRDLPALATERVDTAASSAACISDADTLCVQNNRFAVEVDFIAGGGAGVGQRVKLTSDTGYFTFFDPSNVEVVVKVLNGCAINNHYWVFAAGLTDVRVTLRVQDTQAGPSKSYQNPQGVPFQPIQDGLAFATCP